MPAFPSVPNVIRSGWRFGLPAGELIAKVGLHWAFTGSSPTTSVLTALANQMMTAFGTDGAGLMANELQLDGIDLTDLTSPTSAVGSSSSSAIPGTRGSSDIVSPLCATTRYRIDRRYRGGHPKSFWPFGVSGDLGSFNEWSSGFITTVNTDVAALLATCAEVASGGTSVSGLVNVSYFHGSTVFIEPSGRARNLATLRATPIVDGMFYGSLMPQYGVQRRRRGRV